MDDIKNAQNFDSNIIREPAAPFIVIVEIDGNGKDRIQNPLDTKQHLKTESGQLPKLRAHSLHT